jgi:hypothetical protein
MRSDLGCRVDVRKAHRRLHQTQGLGTALGLRMIRRESCRRAGFPYGSLPDSLNLALTMMISLRPPPNLVAVRNIPNFPNLGLAATSSRRDPPERLGVGPGPHPLLIADDAEIDLAIVPDDELVVWPSEVRTAGDHVAFGWVKHLDIHSRSPAAPASHSLRRPFQGRRDSATGCWGGCSLIWQPTARSSEASALPSSASTCTTWSSTCSTSRTVERTVA